jgi:hypothetical protein
MLMMRNDEIDNENEETDFEVGEHFWQHNGTSLV